MTAIRLRGAMVGGGLGSLIGPVHVRGATMDGEAEIVAGAFSRDSEKNRKTGESMGIAPERVYSSYTDLIEKEFQLTPEERIDFVIVATPNNTHFEIANSLLQAGFHVFCDKPMTVSLEQARNLEATVKKTGKIFVLTHAYTGYPMIKHARDMVRNGELGDILKVVVQYPQGWLSYLLRDPKSERPWRLDPKISGPSCCMSDIGTHAENMARYITGNEIDKLCADVDAYIPDNPLDDDAHILLRYKNGAKGIIMVSQVLSGLGNNLHFAVYGTEKSITWQQEDPNHLMVYHNEGYQCILSRGNDYLSDASKSFTRLPPAHPEGLIEAFGNIYREGFRAVKDAKNGNLKVDYDFPNVHDGVIGMAFVEAVLENTRSENKWSDFRV